MENNLIDKLKSLHSSYSWQCADCGTDSDLISEAISEIEKLRVVNTELRAEVLRYQGMNIYG